MKTVKYILFGLILIVLVGVIVQQQFAIEYYKTRIPSQDEVQQGLLNLGFDPGPIDGVCGKRTRSAWTLYEAFYGLHIPKDVK